jgi:hypothetical protein
MLDNKTIRDILLKLNDGEFWYWPESDYGLAKIYKAEDYLILFGIPTYGAGDTYFVDVYKVKHVGKLIDHVRTWT